MVEMPGRARAPKHPPGRADGRGAAPDGLGPAGARSASAARRLRVVAAAVPASVFGACFAVLLAGADAPPWAYVALTAPTALAVLAVAWPRSGQRRMDLEDRPDAPVARGPGAEIAVATAEHEDPLLLPRRAA